LPGVGSKTIHRWWRQHQNIETIWSQINRSDDEKTRALQRADQHYRQAEANGITILTIDQDRYPDKLTSIDEISPVTYVRGALAAGKSGGGHGWQ
jgi:predicted Rossmann fold nucleotide-binding protein DprA/Smf involved in DNA uptake